MNLETLKMIQGEYSPVIRFFARAASEAFQHAFGLDVSESMSRKTRDYVSFPSMRR